MANQISNVSFTSPYAAEEEEILRRRRLAEQLQAQSMSPDGGTQMVGGWAIQKSPLEGLAKVAQGAAGAYQDRQATELAKALRERAQGDRSSDMTALAAMLKGSPGGLQADAADNVTQMPARPAGQIDPAMLGSLKSPEMQNTAMQMYLQQMQRENAPPKYHVVNGSLVPEPRPGQQGPVAPAFTAPKYHTVGGNLVAEPAPGAAPGAAVKPVFSAPEKDEAAKFNAILKGAGIDPASPAGQQLFKALAMKTATHQPPTQVTTNVSTEKKYGEQFAGQIAKADSDMRDAAIKAPQLAERANQIKQLLSTGNAITGTAADFRLQFAKAAQLAGLGSGSAADTEQLSISMAQNTLDAIKASGLGSGTGFSNADRDFLEKAVGGKITLEKETVSRLADLAHRASVKTAEKWNTRVKEIPRTALEGTGIKADPIAVPALFAPAGASGLTPEEERELKALRGRFGR